MDLAEPAPDLVSNFERNLVADFAERVQEWSRCRQELVKWGRTHLCEDTTPDGLAKHKRMVEHLIFFGQVFSLATSHPDFPDTELSQQVQANLWILRDLYQMYHNPMDDAEADRLLKEVFPES
jgi:hypothetical protein